MKNYSPIVHIGFPKTGTTFLKKYVFPKLSSEAGFIFNPPEFLKISRQRLIYNNEDRSALQSLFNHNKVLISREHLIDTNPRNWENAADRVLDLFGHEAQIIITIRNPLEFLSSAYVQLIHNGNIIKAENFFLNSEEYNKLDPFLPKEILMRLDYEKLNYQHLKEIYESRFAQVYFVPLTRLDSLYPYSKLFSLNQETINKFQKIFKNSPKENRSYSQTAMNLTFYREKFFRLLGLRSIGAEDIPETNDFIFYSDVISKFSDLSFQNKLKSFLPKALSKFKNTLGSWRWWIQNIFDKIYPYKKYNLPETVINKMNSKLMEDNNTFVKNLEKFIDSKNFL